MKEVDLHLLFGASCFLLGFAIAEGSHVAAMFFAVAAAAATALLGRAIGQLKSRR